MHPSMNCHKNVATQQCHLKWISFFKFLQQIQFINELNFKVSVISHHMLTCYNRVTVNIQTTYRNDTGQLRTVLHNLNASLSAGAMWFVYHLEVIYANFTTCCASTWSIKGAYWSLGNEWVCVVVAEWKTTNKYKEPFERGWQQQAGLLK